VLAQQIVKSVEVDAFGRTGHSFQIDHYRRVIEKAGCLFGLIHQMALDSGLVQLEKMQDRQRKQTALEFKGQRFRVGLMGEAQQHDDAGGPCRVLDACALFYTPSCVGESVIMAVSVNMMRRVGGDLTLTVEQPARLCWKNRSGATF
jgi:hypothetical protein